MCSASPDSQISGEDRQISIVPGAIMGPRGSRQKHRANRREDCHLETMSMKLRSNTVSKDVTPYMD